MEKRLLLAIGLSLLVLLSWSALVSKTQPVDIKQVTNKQAQTVISPPSQNIIAPVELSVTPEALVEFENDKMRISFVEASAAIKDVIFKHHKNDALPLKYGFLLNDNSLKFNKYSQDANSISFVHSDPTKKVVKNFIFHKDNYTIDLEIVIKNNSNALLKFNLPLVLGTLDFSASNIESRYQDIIVATQDKTSHITSQKDQRFSNLKFLGLRNRYSCLIAEPVKTVFTGFISKLKAQEIEAGLNIPELTIPVNSQIGQLFHIYLGPQDIKILNAVNPDWTSIIYYGTFDFISQILLQTLEFLYRLFHNWGLAIIVLSILLYFLLYPLSIKQMRSMKEMQAIQPLVEEIRQKHKENPQKMNKEIMDLYRLHKVNPFGGCLPLILQMPLFFALYNGLMRSIFLRGANFLWIKDLSEPDRLFILPVSLPILGNELNILPIIMAVGMFFQQKISASSMGGAAQEQQKIMLVLMPIMFGLIFYRMPAGLVLYWFVNSILMLVFQLRMNRSK